MNDDLLKDLNHSRLRKIALLAICYAALSFAFSFLGFIHQVPSSFPSEYSAPRLLVEVSGHFAFGFLASLPLLDIQLSALTGALAVLIDSDHLLSALGFPVSGRPDHSILYALVSLIALIYFGNKLRLDSSTIVKLAFIAPITVLSHVSYDIFAGTGPGFPLMVPFDFIQVTLPFYFWYILEAAAIGLSVAGFFLARKYSINEKKKVGQKQRVVETREPVERVR